jgi:hypothetical protein
MADLVTPMAIRVAATLRVADRIADGSSTALALAEEAGADPDALDRLLRHLVDAGLFDRDDAGSYTLTPRGEALRDDDHRARGPCRHRQRDRTSGPVLRPPDALDANRPARVPGSSAARSGRIGLRWLGRCPTTRRWAWTSHGGRRDRRRLDWGELGHVVDVGGGNGTLLVALLRAYPALRGTVVDQPRTIAAARESWRERA